MELLADPQCPECGNSRLYKSGLRYMRDGSTVQRWLCRSCNYRFSGINVKLNVTGKILKTLDTRSDLLERKISDRNLSRKKSFDNASFSLGENVTAHMLTVIGKDINSFPYCNSKHRVCAEKAKNLENKALQIETPAAGTVQEQSLTDIKGKIVEYTFYMQKQGYSDGTIRLNRTALKVLVERGANLLDVESVKETMAKQKTWSENRKRNVINAYTLFLKLNGLTWEKPKCKVTRKFPFIPTEAEIDSLISGTGKKTATFLELMKQTAMRCGEAKRLQWTNIDVQRNIITLNDPEKQSNPRQWKVNQKLMDMLSAMPKESQKIFGESSTNSMKTTFIKARKRLAAKLQNPRLLQVSFHTLRHWKATMEYHRTKDPYYVKQFLGHKSIQNTELYINIERTLFESGNDSFTVKVAETPEEVKALLEVGFEYVCQKDNLIFLRKAK